MLLNVRKATAEDAPALVDLYDRAYRGGYSATFDRYGPIRPEDFWWVQSEKEVFVIDLDRAPAGLVVISRRAGDVAVEEIVGPWPLPSSGRAVTGGRREQALLQRLGEFLRRQARGGRRERLVVRTPEANPLGLALVRHLGLPFANTLIVSAVRPRARQAVHPPDGYAVRKAVGADLPEIRRIAAECDLSDPAALGLERALRRPDARVVVAERQAYPVGFLMGEARAGGFGDFVVGVREAHRRRGIGRALAAPALNFFAVRGLPAVGLHWGQDGGVHGFYRGLGFATERVYLFFEKAL